MCKHEEECPKIKNKVTCVRYCTSYMSNMNANLQTVENFQKARYSTVNFFCTNSQDYDLALTGFHDVLGVIDINCILNLLDVANQLDVSPLFPLLLLEVKSSASHGVKYSTSIFGFFKQNQKIF